MPIPLDQEQLLTLVDAAEVLPALRGGRPIHVSTLYRWISRGVRGVRLEAVRLGGTLLTSREALQRFASGVTVLHEPRSLTPKPDRTRIERAERELDRHGL